MKKILFLALATCSLTSQVQANTELDKYAEKLNSYNYKNEIGKETSPIVLKHPKNVQIPEDMADAFHELNFAKISLLYSQLGLSYANSFVYAENIKDQAEKESYQKRILCDQKHTEIDYKHFLIANKNIIDQNYARNPNRQSYSEKINDANKNIASTESKLSGYDCLKEYIKQ